MAFIRPLAFFIGVAGAAALAYSCSSKGSTNSPPPPTYTLSKVSGDSQVGSANAALGANLVVLVQDQNNAPAAGITVSWLVGTGGGSVPSATSQTDASGHAAMGRTLGPAAGFQTASASLAGAGGSPITFTSISQIQGAFTISQGTGTGQADSVLSTLTAPFQFLVKDHTGAPAAGVIVNFAVTAGGGTLSQLADTSDAGGAVTTTLTLPANSGVKTVHGTVTGLVGSPVSFTATASAGNAGLMAKSAGDSQGALISTQIPNPHAVLITDAHGNPVNGFQVHWSVGTGGGSVSDTTPTSNGSGLASVFRTLGGSLGPQTDTAKTSLPGSPILFTSFGDSLTHIGAVTVGPGISYSPTTVTIGNGGTVTWTWASGSIAHQVQWLTAPGTLPTGSNLQSSGTYSWTFTTPGTYTYDCSIHGAAMSGTITVK
jgi:plastocyanin